jgi:nucleotide-binding universal stress UspA family protein
MNKILVTTDFSVSSKAGIRFALQFARQTKSKLIFFHAQKLLRPTRWSDEKYNAYAAVELKESHGRLKHLVDDVCRQTGFNVEDAQFIIQEGYEVASSVIEYAIHSRANYICMSTRGAGAFKKLIGTNASDLITTSPVPVIIVPTTYRSKQISTILYSSDLVNLNAEMKKVVRFSTSLKATISVYHYGSLLPLKEAKMKLERLAAKNASKSVKFHFQKNDIEKSLGSSKSAAFSFETKIPLLVFKKESKDKQ